ncbi:MAG: hypothetical protein JWR33_2492 [Naasia sp.]|jgi:hypothetical protein|uniref:hypothetical protein n=1 Tax=Naasia sp. TaxID=2546198 RepID=UPI0026197727|nr:hypothetical protein [Naasia sp.]MCU1571751.1 hypothetical protein [Naasia sp.]
MVRDTQRQDAMLCDSPACSDDRPGHAMTLIRLRLSAVSPRGWVDAVVTDSSDDGRLELTEWRTGAVCTVWHHQDLGGSLPLGCPVALHDAYSVLAVGRHRYNVAIV